MTVIWLLLLHGEPALFPLRTSLFLAVGWSEMPVQELWERSSGNGAQAPVLAPTPSPWADSPGSLPKPCHRLGLTWHLRAPRPLALLAPAGRGCGRGARTQAARHSSGRSRGPCASPSLLHVAAFPGLERAALRHPSAPAGDAEGDTVADTALSSPRPPAGLQEPSVWPSVWGVSPFISLS